MSELEKSKSGLQKKVSSVFKGVPLPQGSAGQQTSGTPAPSPIPDASPKPTPPDRRPGSSLMAKLHQAEETPGNTIPNGTAKVGPEPAPPTHRLQQHPAAGELHEIKTQPRKTASAKQRKAPPVAETTSVGLWRQINDRLFAPKPGVNPTRQKAMVILVPILAIVMIFVFRQVLSTSPRKTLGATDKTLVTAGPQSGQEIDWQVPAPLPATMRDPLKFPEVTPASNAEPNESPAVASATSKTGVIDVRDVIYSKDKPSAFMNGRIVYVGDKVHGITVVQINRDSVEFEKDGKRWVQNVRD
jgi:hypothetical protein